MAPPAIQTRQLTKYYGRQLGIEDIELMVPKGEVFGFLGPNGAGKTTTIRLLLDLIRPTGGTASILGLDCRREGLAVRRKVGYLPGEFTLYENLTGQQLLLHLGSLRGGVDWKRVEELATRLGADLGRSIRSLSSGNKQKLAVIQAFMTRPEVLILDEPTSGLDPLIQQEFFGLVHEARTGGATVFLSSHNLTEVERVCDRVASIRCGRLVAVEEVDAVRSRTVRIVRLTCERALDAERFTVEPGIGEVQVDGRHLRCRVEGPLGRLIALAEPHGIIDLLSREPNLEETFLALYGHQGGDDAG